MIDLQQRYETIKSACENLKLQTKPALRIKTNVKLSPHTNQKTRKIPKWCIDRIPSDAQIIGETGITLSCQTLKRIGWVYEIGSIESIVGRDYRVTSVALPFVCVLRDDSDKNYPHEICKNNTHTEKLFYVQHA